VLLIPSSWGSQLGALTPHHQGTQYQQSQRNYHSTHVRPRSFVVGDLVLQLKQDGHGKLESPWVGSYIVTEVILGGA
jgi:hypothetical protein